MWTALAFTVVGAIHLMPVAPVFVPETLSRLYGVAPGDTTLLVLLRHRALLFVIVGALCLWASWWTPVRPAALLAAAINVVGFLGFYALRQSGGSAAGHRDRRPDRPPAARLRGVDDFGPRLAFLLS